MNNPILPKPRPLSPSQRLAMEELAHRRGLIASSGSFRLEDYLFDKQLDFVLDPSPFKEATTTRRAGKSVSCVADLMYTALNSHDCTCLYITLSRKNAKRLVWPEFKKLALRFNIKAEFNESDLSIKILSSGSMVYLLGASDRASIEDFRGLAIKKVYLDESQSFPSYIEQLIDDVLGPALMDHDGQLILIGTPGPIPSGYFYELTKNPNWAHHFWSFFDNSKLPFLHKGLTHQDMLNRELKRRGVTPLDPSIQREWFGKWIVDKNSLVYQYDSKVCHYEVLPQGDWTYILGIDLGFNDADALAVLAFSEQYPDTYLIEEIVTKRQDITALCGQIDKLRSKYAVTKIVIDTGGLGKKIAEEMGKRYKIPMQSAEKVRKTEYIELMNDALRTGRLRIKSNSLFASDSTKVEWDHDRSTPDKKVISKRFHSDICEAVLYAWRESYSYSYQLPEAETEYGSKAWSDKEGDKMFEGELQRLQEAQGDVEEDTEVDLDSTFKLDRPTIRYHKRFLKGRKGPG